MSARGRAKDFFAAWALIERSGDRLALLNSEVPVYWLRGIAEARAKDLNRNAGREWVRVEKITIHRVDR